jgi:Mn2+/Fe2+ NRAMP family transporter
VKPEPVDASSAPRGLQLVRWVGPGLVVAATGVGAGDMVAAAKAGAAWGTPLLWTVLVGALLKFVLAEGVARWQLATGSTLLEGWSRLLGRPLRIAFLLYLLVWTIVVAAALMSACGLAAHALLPRLSVSTWAILHAVCALGLVWFGGYGGFETIMKWVIGIMFVCIVGSALRDAPPTPQLMRGLLPGVPHGGLLLTLAVIGGVGGTLTLLSYNYWMDEKGWQGPGWIHVVRCDLAVGYTLTGLFGAAVLLLAASLLHPAGIRIEGSSGVLNMAGLLGTRFGQWGEWLFLVGFWGAVASSLLGVWQSVPYLYFDFVHSAKSGRGVAPRHVDRRSAAYRGYLLFMTFPPMLLLTLERPIWLVVSYAALGALFMPFLAGTLLALNNRRAEMGRLRNGRWANAGLVLCVLLFGLLGFMQISDRVLR